jgi:hypothetical protein
MVRAIRRRRAASKERKLARYAESAGLKELRDQQSPFRAKWGFFPK